MRGDVFVGSADTVSLGLSFFNRIDFGRLSCTTSLNPFIATELIKSLIIRSIDLAAKSQMFTRHCLFG